MERLVTIDANDLLQLLLHYNDGQDIPLNTHLLNVGVSPIFERWICLMCEAESWPSGHFNQQFGALTPLHIRYEGNRIMVLSAPRQEPNWTPAPDAPRRQ